MLISMMGNGEENEDEREQISRRNIGSLGWRFQINSVNQESITPNVLVCVIGIMMIFNFH